MMYFDDVVGRVGVEPTYRLFDMRPIALSDAHTRIYRRQPLLVALAVCNSPVKNRTIFADGPVLMILF